MVKDVNDLKSTVGNSQAGMVKDVNDLKGDVNDLTSTVGNSQSGMVKDVNDLKSTVGNSQAGLVKDVRDLESSVFDLNATVGNRQSGMVKDVNDLKSTVGNSQAGMVKDVNDLKSTVGNSQAGMVKDVNDLKSTVGNSQSGMVKDVNDLKSDVSGYETRFEVDEEKINRIEYRLQTTHKRSVVLTSAPAFASGSFNKGVSIRWCSGDNASYDCCWEVKASALTTETFNGKTYIKGTLTKKSSFANREQISAASGVIGGFYGGQSTSYATKYIPIPFFISGSDIYFELPINTIANGDWYGIFEGYSIMFDAITASA